MGYFDVSRGVKRCSRRVVDRKTNGRCRWQPLRALLLCGLFFTATGCDPKASAPTLPTRPDLRSFPVSLASAVTEAEAQVGVSAEGARARLQLGQIYQANGFPVEARHCYLPLVADSEEGAKACYYLGILALAADDLEEGRKWLAESLRLAPGHVPAQLRLADACYKSGLVDEAAALHAAVLRQESDNIYAHLATARERLRLGDVAGATRLLRDLTTAHPEFGAGCALFAQVLDRAGDRTGAAAMRERALTRKDPPAPDPWSDEMMKQCYDVQRLAMLFEDYAKAGRVDESLNWLQRLEAVDPNHWLVCQIRAFAFSAKGRLGDAVREYERALAAGGDARRLYPALVGTLTEMQRYAEAEAKAQAGMVAAPGTPALLVAVAQLRRAQGNSVEAERLLSEALAIEPRSASANRSLALIWWDRGEKQKALPLLRVVRETAPSDFVTRGMVGEYLLEQENPAEAVGLLQEAMALAPGNDGIADLLALALLRTGNLSARSGNFAEAVAAYDRAIVVRPGHREALTNKARLCLRLGQFAQAEDALQRLSVQQPDSPSVLMALGDAQHAGDHDERARASWTRALQLAQGAENHNLRNALSTRLQGAVSP